MSTVEIIDRADVTMTGSAEDIIIVADFDIEVIQELEQGPPGPMGPESTTPGPPGPMGPQGYPGADGNTILYGTSNPTPETGSNGDSFINKTTNMLFGPKAAGVWPAGVSIVGPQGPQGIQGIQGIQGAKGDQGIQGVPGADGNTVLYGASDPITAVGVPGNFYINQSTSKLFGPKTSVWPAGVSMIGPQGPQGIQGIPGAIAEAPVDGVIYGRMNAGWVPNVATGAVRYDVVQAQTVAQQLQARQNIYAAPMNAMDYSGIQVNGNFDIANENGAASVPVLNTAKFIADVWTLAVSHPTMQVFGQKIAVGALKREFVNAMTMTASPGSASMAAADYVQFYQAIEGYRLQRLGWGGSNGQPLTVAFWVLSNTSVGNATFSVRNSPTVNRSYCAPFTVNAVNVWEYKTVTIPPPDNGSVWANDHTAAAFFGWCFAAGANYIDAPNQWLSGSNRFAATGQSNFFPVSNAGMTITGVIILPGPQAPDSERQPLVCRRQIDETILVQRYFRRFVWTLEGYSFGSQARVTAVHQMPPMRTSPAVVRQSIAASTNIRAADTNQFVVCSPFNDMSMSTSIECAAAGYAYAQQVVEHLTARP